MEIKINKEFYLLIKNDTVPYKTENTLPKQGVLIFVF